MAHAPEPTPPKTKRRSHWPWAFVLIILIFAALASLIFWRLESWPARTARQGTEQLERLGRDLRAVFIDVAHLQPKITINDRVYLEQTAPTAELVTVMRRTEVEHDFTHTWAGSTKSIRLRGTFLVKAGFDLRKDFSVDVRANEIAVHLPRAQILGVEEQRVDVLEFQNGFWNKISNADLEHELRALPQLARQKAAAASLAVEAETTLRGQLEQRINAPQTVHVDFQTPPTPAPTLPPLPSPNR